MKKSLLVAMMMVATTVFAQEIEKETNASGGEFALGIRSTSSLFGNDGFAGSGFGAQFRLRISDRLNTEWFVDYITTNIDDLGRRVDGHIGWSVMFYPLDPTGKTLTPYLLAGHCFDYTKLSVNNIPTYTDHSEETEKRWSSAVQIGIGTSWHLNDRFDVSLSSQYMTHLGNDIHSEIHEEDGIKTLHVGEHDGEEDHGSGLSLEGHILVTLSLNFNIADLW